MGIVRDWIALPFILFGALFYLIGEAICGKKFSRRGDMAIAGNEIDMTMSLNREGRRARARGRR